MANVAEKVSDMAKDKPGPEKRRALGRGLESLLPGPRVVVNAPPAPRNAATPAHEETAEKPASTLSQSARKDGSGSQVSGTERREPGAPSGEAEPTSGIGTTPLKPNAGLNGAPGEPGAPLAHDRADSVPVSQSPSASPMAGLERPIVRNDGIGGETSGSQVSGTERREPGAPSREAEPTSGIGATPLKPNAGLNGAPGRLAAPAGGPVAGKVGDLQAGKDPNSFDGVQVVELALGLIDANPYQTRHFTQEDEDDLIELGKSIRAQGLIQPITVREGKNGRYILIAGSRRTRAARWAEMETIPAIVWDVSEQQAAEITVIENLMREDLNCMDQMRAFILLSSKFHMTQAEIAERMGMSRESVSNYMRLSRLPSEVQDYLVSGELEFSHARQLLKVEDDAMLLKLAERVVKENIPVWQLEEMMLGGVPAAFKAGDEEKQKRGARWVDPNVRAAQRDLERALGMRVRIRDRNNKGKITIEYSTLEDFDRVVGVLRGK
jgi:ParB family chromosome partitioning protein